MNLDQSTLDIQEAVEVLEELFETPEYLTFVDPADYTKKNGDSDVPNRYDEL
jgi:hypothetical protein